MHARLLRLDPALLLHFTAIDAVQLGVQEPVVRLRADDATLAALARLRRGALRAELDQVLGRDRASALLDAVAPALDRGRRPRLGVRVLGTIDLAGELATVVRADGHAAHAQPRLDVPVAAWRVPPRTLQRLLHTDRPHLPVVVGDAWAQVGPFTVPGRSGCSRCLELDEGPLVLPAHLDPPPLSTLARMQLSGTLLSALDRAASHRLAIGSTWRIALRDGSISELRAEPHPACGCRALPGSAMAA